MIDKIVSILLGLILGIILYNQFLQKNTIILNYKYDLHDTDKFRINNKCYKSN